jgi:SAM-dependent methyltransferase
VVQADATALPFLAYAFDAAVAVNVLDHLAEPTVAIGEAYRVLARGGILVAATASRRDSPELAEVWCPPPSSFDAEDGPRLVASIFGQVRVERCDAPLVRLPDTDAVRDYLIARFVTPRGCRDRRRTGPDATCRHQAGCGDPRPQMTAPPDARLRSSSVTGVWLQPTDLYPPDLTKS